MTPVTEERDPRVSVVVIFLNAQPFFEEAIESIRAQDYGDWELVLVDDGSTDGSDGIARRYAEAEPSRIRYLAHAGRENRGMSASRNLGVRAGRGEFVAFLDADDTWLQGKLTRQVAFLDSYPTAALTYGPTLRWYSWDGETPDESRVFPIEVDRAIDPPHLVRWLLERQAAPAMGSILARRCAVLDVGGFEDEFRDLYEDQVFHLKMFLRYGAYVSSECWDRYRKHADSACIVASPEQHILARRRFLDFARRHLLDSGCRDPEIWWRLHRERQALPPDADAPRASVVESARATAHVAMSYPRIARLRTSVRVVSRQALDAARTHRRLTDAVLDKTRRNGSATLLRLPPDLVSDEYAFSLASSGWHYLRALLAEHAADPELKPAESLYFRFFTHERMRAVRYLDDVLFLHRDDAQHDSGLYFGTYPWGDWTESDARVGGKPFGHHFDAVEGADTRDLYGYRRNPWYRPGDEYPLSLEWRRTTELYRSLSAGYRPRLYGSIPSVVLLVRESGTIRAVRHRGHHRLATLAHLGYHEVTMAVDPDSIRVVREAEVEDWYNVRNGRCSPERALEIFNAFFELDGSERAASLDLPKPY
jgi:glycosyltransferase involved in cell wall biosynthesis